MLTRTIVTRRLIQGVTQGVIRGAPLTAAVALSACQAPPQEGDVIRSARDTDPPVAAVLATPLLAGEGRVRAILNAGAMGEVAARGKPVKFLFDPLYDDHFGSLEELPDDLIETIVAGNPPYDGVSLVFVTHAHGDHFSARHLARMMAAQPDVRMIAPEQALERLKKAEEWEPGFASRVTTITLENGEQSEILSFAGAQVEAFRSPHAGWPDRHASVHNLTFRVSVPDGKGRILRVMHVGDADPDPVHFEPHEPFLSRARTGLVLVPFWFASDGTAPEKIETQLNAQDAVAVHIPQKEPEWLAASAWNRFTEEGQTLPVPMAP